MEDQDMNQEQPQAVDNEPRQTSEKPKKKQGAGKKVLVVLFSLLLLGGVAYGTYYLTKQQAEEDAAAVIAPLKAQVEELEAELAELESSDSESAEGGYLEIEQWGVRIKSTESGMSYKITKNSDGTETSWLTNKDALALAEDAEDASCNKEQEDGTPNHWYLVAITRSKVKLTGVYESITPTKIGDYYYYAEQGNGSCSKEEAINAEATARNELYKAAQTVEASEE